MTEVPKANEPTSCCVLPAGRLTRREETCDNRETEGGTAGPSWLEGQTCWWRRTRERRGGCSGAKRREGGYRGGTSSEMVDTRLMKRVWLGSTPGGGEAAAERQDRRHAPPPALPPSRTATAEASPPRWPLLQTAAHHPAGGAQHSQVRGAQAKSPFSLISERCPTAPPPWSALAEFAALQSLGGAGQGTRALPNSSEKRSSRSHSRNGGHH